MHTSSLDTHRLLNGVNFLILSVVLSGVVSCGQSQPPGKTSAAQQSIPSEAYTPPPEGTPSLVQSLEARRDPGGEVMISGKLLLPRGTQVWVELFPLKKRAKETSLGMVKAHVTAGGSIVAGPFELPTPGQYRVQLTSVFNGAWQSPEVLAVVGSSGARLPKSALKPDDPEFPQAGGYLEYWGLVHVAELSADLKAIEAVKSAKLFVKGNGQAVDTIGEIVKFFDKPGFEFYPGEWSAAMGTDGKWKVSLQHRWGNEQKTANWEYDPRTKKVKYLDPEAKMLSWIPAE